MALLRVTSTRQLARAGLKQSCFQFQHARGFIGLGEVVSVVANPAETIRQLKESKDLLRQAREDMALSNEAKKIPKKHTFSKLPGFHGRETEKALLRKILSNYPKMTVIFGATSVGKTALMREVLAGDDFYVIPFDLRISGFADLRTLYVALCEQFERFFDKMHDEEMDKQKLVFKHLVLGLIDKEKAGNYEVSVADIASLMESMQSCLLKFWEYEPPKPEAEEGEATDAEALEKPRDNVQDRKIDATQTEDKTNVKKESSEDEKPSFKKKPIVFLMDEAHKLPALVDNQLSLKVFLDTLLVLTKQDRLCHVFLSTSDSFFQHFLRSMNVGHHAQILTIGDPSKKDTYSYFQEQIVPQVPDELKSKVNFDEIYEAFGGKLSHINDYMSSWVNADGDLTPYTSAIFVQAYTLLNFHLTHSNFETFSPLSTATSGTSTENDDARFSPEDLIYVMQKVTEPPYSLPYFTLCRKIGTEQVDSMIKTRILELRWTKTVTPEEDWIERSWSKDGVERPIVLPMTRMIRQAMKIVLKEQNELAKTLMQEATPSKADDKDDAKTK